MDKLDVLYTMKSTIDTIEQRMLSPDAIEVEDAKLEMKELVKRFRQEYEHFMSLQQYEWARDDLDYFKFLLEEALAYYKKMLIEDGKIS